MKKKDPKEKILCAVIPHPDVPRGIVQPLEDRNDWSQFRADLKEDMAVKGTPIRIEFWYFTREYVDGLEEV